MKIIKSTALLGTLGLALAACSNGSNVVLTPQPPLTGTSYTQIERLSRPAVKEVFEKFVDHQVSNKTEPYDTVNDPLKGEISSLADALRPPKNGADYGALLSSILYPDEYAVDLSTNTNGPVGSSYGTFLSYELAHATNAGTAFGGRAPNDDVIGLELAVVFGGAAQATGLQPEDGQENNCLATQNLTLASSVATTSTFPYLVGPH